MKYLIGVWWSCVNEIFFEFIGKINEGVKFEIIDKITNSIHIIDPYFMIYFEKLEKEIKKYNINII